MLDLEKAMAVMTVSKFPSNKQVDLIVANLEIKFLILVINCGYRISKNLAT